MKSYTDLEQSKVLSKILPLESADYYHATDAGVVIIAPYITYCCEERCVPAYKGAVPCWSLAALLDAIPDSIYDNTNEFSQLEFSKRSIAYHDLNDGIKIGSFKDNLIDACYEMITRLNELNLL